MKKLLYISALIALFLSLNHKNMKKIFFTIFVCGILAFIPDKAKAQDYHTLIRPNVYWDVMMLDAWQVYPCQYFHGDRYFFRGDTTIQDIQYQILRKYSIVSQNTNGHFCPPYAVNGNSSSIAAFMREDVEKQQVFMYYPHYSNQKEILLYDFSLKKGDTLFGNLEDPYGMVIN